MVALAVFVVLGQFDQGLRAVRVARGGKLGERAQGGVLAAAPLLHLGDLPQRAEQQMVRQTEADGAVQQRDRLVVAPGLSEPARQADPIGAVRQGRISGRTEGQRHDGGQAGQAQDVDGVVVEDGHQPLGLPGAQVLEVDVGDHLAGKVALPFDPQDLVLQFHEAATVQAQFPQAPRAGQQVQVTFESLRNQPPLTGVLGDIPSYGDYQNGLTIFQVPVQIQGRLPANLRVGMTANVYVPLERRANVLLVPAAAVQYDGQKHFVQLVRGNNVEQRKVTKGISDGTYTEILEGLNEGDKVRVAMQGPNVNMGPWQGGNVGVIQGGPGR